VAAVNFTCAFVCDASNFASYFKTVNLETIAIYPGPGPSGRSTKAIRRNWSSAWNN